MGEPIQAFTQLRKDTSHLKNLRSIIEKTRQGIRFQQLLPFAYFYEFANAFKTKISLDYKNLVALAIKRGFTKLKYDKNMDENFTLFRGSLYWLSPAERSTNKDYQLEFTERIATDVKSFNDFFICPTIPNSYTKVVSNNPCCYLCGRQVSKSEVDHILPVILSFVLCAIDFPLNYAETHHDCNNKKRENLIGQSGPKQAGGMYTAASRMRQTTSRAVASRRAPSARPSAHFIRVAAEQFEEVNVASSSRSTKNLSRLHSNDLTYIINYFNTEQPDAFTKMCYQELVDFYTMVYDVCQNSKVGGAPPKTSQSRKTQRVSRISTDLTTYEDTNVEWPNDERSSFLEYRYLMLYKASKVYFESFVFVSSGSNVKFSKEDYCKFIKNRVDHCRTYMQEQQNVEKIVQACRDSNSATLTVLAKGFLSAV